MKFSIPFVAVFLAASLCHAQETEKSPEDRPVSANEGDLDKLIAPYIELSRKQFPEIRKRFLAGLPANHRLYVTVRLFDREAKIFEQIFILVKKIDDSGISGTIASEISKVSGYQEGDPYICKPSEIRDWTITAPGGREEGNYVGKFLDILQDGRVPLIVEMKIGKDGKVSGARFESAINRYKQDVSYCIPEEAKREAVRVVRNLRFDPQETESTQYTYVIYRYHEKKIEQLKKTDSDPESQEN